MTSSKVGGESQTNWVYSPVNKPNKEFYMTEIIKITVAAPCGSTIYGCGSQWANHKFCCYTQLVRHRLYRTRCKGTPTVRTPAVTRRHRYRWPFTFNLEGQLSIIPFWGQSSTGGPKYLSRFNL